MLSFCGFFYFCGLFYFFYFADTDTVCEKTMMFLVLSLIQIFTIQLVAIFIPKCAKSQTFHLDVMGNTLNSLKSRQQRSQ